MRYRPQVDKTSEQIEIRIGHNIITWYEKITKMATCRRPLQFVTCRPIQAAVLDSVFLFYL